MKWLCRRQFTGFSHGLLQLQTACPAILTVKQFDQVTSVWLKFFSDSHANRRNFWMHDYHDCFYIAFRCVCLCVWYAGNAMPVWYGIRYNAMCYNVKQGDLHNLSIYIRTTQSKFRIYIYISNPQVDRQVGNLEIVDKSSIYIYISWKKRSIVLLLFGVVIHIMECLIQINNNHMHTISKYLYIIVCIYIYR